MSEPLQLFDAQTGEKVTTAAPTHAKQMVEAGKWSWSATVSEAPPAPEMADLGDMTVDEVLLAVGAGDMTADEALKAEKAGKGRKTLIKALEGE